MKELRIGEVIQNRRKELGLTQAEVCEGICEPMKNDARDTLGIELD